MGGKFATAFSSVMVDDISGWALELSLECGLWVSILGLTGDDVGTVGAC